MRHGPADHQTPEDLTTSLIGKSVGGYEVVRYIDRGASALVFEAKYSKDEKVALKVFDPAFIKKFGDDIQVKRIKRQLLLKGIHHDHLIDILDGGQCESMGLHFLVMPLLEVPSLDKVLNKVPRESIWTIISQVAAAAQFLEQNKMCHRDIKPANIAATGDNYNNAILLDLGVLKPLGLRDLTDTSDTKEFVGTTRYSPPEFLVRDENDSIEGFRSVTFYQLGAVLHDLIMRRPLFHDKLTPYARLVQAVLLEEPTVESSDVLPELVRLARMCLQKDPARRVLSLDWTAFTPRPHRLPTREEAKRRTAQLRAAITSGLSKTTTRQDRAKMKSVLAQLREAIKQACIDDKEHFPPCAVVQRDLDGTTAIITLDFAASHQHGLNQRFTFAFRLEATAGDKWTFAVHTALALHFGETRLNINTAPFRTLGEAFSENELADECVTALYAGILAALEESAAIFPTGNSVRWIELEGK